MITISNLSKKSGNIKILSSINLSIKYKDVIGIIGPSGSGKSTLLRCINYLEEPSSGKIFINNQRVTSKNAVNICSKIGMAFQNFNLFPHMTVIDNITYSPIKVHNISRIDAEAKAQKLLEAFNLTGLRDNLPKKLSGGQKQRVAIIRALIMNPEVMMFDEPTSALDLESIKDLIRIIKELYSKNITMLIVSHQIDFIKKVATRIVFMDKGQMLEDSPTEAFFSTPSSYRAKIFLENIGL